MPAAATIDAAFEARDGINAQTGGETREAVEEALNLLDTGALRVAEIADKGSSFRGITERAVEGGTIASTVKAMGEWEVELVATGTRDDWQATIRARVNLTTGPRVVWWEKTQGPVVPPTPTPVPN